MGFITGSNIRVLLSASALALFASLTVVHASSFKVLHSFSGGSDGCTPVGGLILDGASNLYGTTAGETCDTCGTVFKLAPNGTETLLHNFTCGDNGEGPGANLVFDKKGNLYGTTVNGGSIGCGVIFKVTPAGREKTVHDFAGPPSDGCSSIGALIMDKSGDFYGTTGGGGKNSLGAIFELAADGTVSILYSFCRKVHCADGQTPYAGLTANASGNLYGITQSGGRLGCGNQCGTVFELAPDGTETVLYKFRGPPNDGNNPDGNLIIDQSSNFYGTLFTGGQAGCFEDTGCGAAFKLASDGTYSVLHFFTGKTGDGANPVAGLIADSADNLYGTTEYGGGRGCIASPPYGCGTIFELTPDGTETVLHSFGKGNNGANPTAGLVADGKGNLYGAASEGGANGYGTVFKFTP
jgi:uncharacterized repeat protein (TIGR03803 family)